MRFALADTVARTAVHMGRAGGGCVAMVGRGGCRYYIYTCSLPLRYHIYIYMISPTQHPCIVHIRGCRAHVADSIDVRHLQTAVAIAEERFCRCHAHPAPMHSAYHRSMGESRSMGGVEVPGGGSRCMGGSRWCMGEHRSSTSGTPSALNPCTSPSSQFPSPSSFT